MTDIELENYLNFMLPGEKPNAEIVLKRMGEHGSCLLSGDTTDLCIMPVDFNPSNILPSNMASISTRYREKAPLVIDYSFTVAVNPPADILIKIDFRSAYQFYVHNKKVLEAEVNHKSIISEKQAAFIVNKDFEDKFNGRLFLELYEELTALHIKGIDRVTLLNSMSMDWSSYQAYLMGTLERKKSTSNIIIPNFGC